MKDKKLKHFGLNRLTYDLLTEFGPTGSETSAIISIDSVGGRNDFPPKTQLDLSRLG